MADPKEDTKTDVTLAPEPVVEKPAEPVTPPDPRGPVKAFQALLADLGHDPGPLDGILGPRTARAYIGALHAGMVKPESATVAAARDQVKAEAPAKDEIEARYGHIEVEDRAKPKGSCILVNIHWSRYLYRYAVPAIGMKLFHRRAAGPFLAAWAEVEAWNAAQPQDKRWEPKSVQTYPGYPRHKGWNPKRGLSTHSWACAFDVDPKENTGANTNIPEPVFAIFRSWGFVCGIDWSEKYVDAMHFQLVGV